MALYTSTPKSKRLIEEEVSLLSLNSENEGEHIYNLIIFFSVYFVIPIQKANKIYTVTELMVDKSWVTLSCRLVLISWLSWIIIFVN
jgi:hypothetical protein